MARAILEFVDIEGEMALNVTFEGGFQTESHAHQQAWIAIQHLDSLNTNAGGTRLSDVLDKPIPAETVGA